MARIGLGSCLGILAFLTTSPAVAAEPAVPPSQAVAAALAVQEAMRQGRELLHNGRAEEAVEVLEAQLTRANGNPAYLALLRDAYTAYVKALQMSHQDERRAVYQKRLQILEHNARANTPAALTPEPPAADKVARGVRAEDDPFQQTPRRGRSAGTESMLSEAVKAFAEKRYRDADESFARAYGSDAVAPGHAPQWAYSKLHGVVARLQQADAGGAKVEAAELEREVSAALRLAADHQDLDAFGRKLLTSIRQRAGGVTSAAAGAVGVRHQGRGSDGWAKAESASFKLFHNQSRDVAEQVLRSAEQARAEAFEKWSGPPKGPWQPVCDVYLYATAADYARATGKPASFPGHATFQAKNGAITLRRLDLRADEPGLLGGVIPHETTHLVLGDLFADTPLPRWADEGMAVLAEPRSQVDRYARTLHACRQRGQLVPLAKILGQTEYPDSAQITVFYVESVSVVEYLVGEKGPRTFVQFLRDLQASGLNAALARHYGCRSAAELQERWLVRTFAESDTRASAAPAQP